MLKAIIFPVSKTQHLERGRNERKRKYSVTKKAIILFLPCRQIFPVS